MKSFKQFQDVEQIDELSKKTLASYAKQATDDVSYYSFTAGTRSATDPRRLKDDKKAIKRQAGVGKAIDRLAKEEVERIDEISAQTARSYRTKASHDAYAGMAGGTTAHKLYTALDDTSGQYTDKYKQKLQHKMDKRKAGIAKADKRIPNETSAPVKKTPERQRDQYGYGGEPGRHYTGDSFQPAGDMIAEISSGLLARYKKKAGEQASHADTMAFKTSDQARARKLLDFAHKRYKGIIKATGKEFEKGTPTIAKEEIDLIEAAKPNELHVSDAGGGKYKVHAVGSKFAHGIKVGEHVTDTHLDDFSEMGGKIKMVKPEKKKD